MDTLSISKEYRENLLKFVRPYLSEGSFIWTRNLLNDINKKIVVCDNDYIAAHSLLMYRNIVKFFRKFCTTLDVGTILLTLYICAIELGIRKLGDEIEYYEEFTDNVDMDDWCDVTYDTIVDFDMVTVMHLISNRIGKERREVFAGGINSLQVLDFVERTGR